MNVGSVSRLEKGVAVPLVVGLTILVALASSGGIYLIMNDGGGVE